MTVLEHARLTIQQGQEADFEAAFEEAKLVLASSPGFLGADLHRGLEQPNTYLLLISWQDLDAHMVTFRGSERYVQYRQLVGPYFAEPPEVDHASPVVHVPAP